MNVELIGYFASFLIIVSFLFKDILHLRIANIVGSITFIAYGIMINSYPIIITNLFLLVINIYQVFKMLKKRPTI